MFTLYTEEVQSLHEAVKYYDCATDPVAYAVVDKLSLERLRIHILTEKEVNDLRSYITGMENAVHNGEFAPSQPTIVRDLLEL